MNTTQQSPTNPNAIRVGWIGIGVMGGAMASRLLSAGYKLTIYARTPSKAVSLQSQGADLASSVTDLAGSCDVIFTMLGHPSDVRQIVLENLVPALQPNTFLVDHTSSHPSVAEQIHEAALERGCFSIDAPVSGGDIGAKEGKLAIFAAGDEGAVEKLWPLFDAMGKVTYMGSAGKGQSCKIANQITIGGNLLGLSEGLVFAEKAGLDKEKFIEAVRGGAAGSMAMELFGRRMIEKDFRPGGFAEYKLKDLWMAVDVGVESGSGSGGGDDDVVVLPGAALCKQLYSGMVANGDGKLATHGLITVIQRLNGS